MDNNSLEMKYINVVETRENKYYQLPKELFESSYYKKTIGLEAKVLYSFLFDRVSLSRKNNWFDKEGNVYLIYTREEICNKLDISFNTSTKAFKQLKEVKLIEEKRQGLGKPNLIYVGKIQHEELEKFLDNEEYSEEEIIPEKEAKTPANTQNRKNCVSGEEGASRPVKIEDLDTQKLGGIKTDNNKTDIISSLSILSKDRKDEIEFQKSLFKENIRYDDFVILEDERAKIVENIAGIIFEVFESTKDEIYINSEPKNIEVVKSQFLKLNPDHIIYVIDSLKNISREVKNIKSYTLTCLFNAVNTNTLDTVITVAEILNKKE